MARLDNFPARAGQTGAVLITASVFMIVLTILVLALVRTGTLEERIARNARDQQVAREAAEAVLRDAETTLFTAYPFDRFDTTQFSAACTNGLCIEVIPKAGKDISTISWSDSVTKTFADVASKIPNLTEQPRYVVEILVRPVRPSSSMPCEPGVARITARAKGNGGAVSMVQSIYRFRVFSNICD